MCAVFYTCSLLLRGYDSLFFMLQPHQLHTSELSEVNQRKRRKMRPELSQRSNLNSVPDAPQVSGDSSLKSEALGTLQLGSIHVVWHKPDVTEGKPGNTESSM